MTVLARSLATTHQNVLLLTDAVASRLRLQIILRVPVLVANGKSNTRDNSVSALLRIRTES